MGKATQILEYFINHPQAVDSLEGVARWRLLEAKVERDISETKAALNWLVTEGYLLEQAPKGAQPMFSLNSDKKAAARRLISGDERKPRRRAD